MERNLSRMMDVGLRRAGAPLLVLVLAPALGRAGQEAPRVEPAAAHGAAAVVEAHSAIGAEEPPVSPAAEEVQRILRRARDPESPSAAEAGAELAPFARQELQLLMEILRDRRVPAHGELPVQALSELQWEIVLEALARTERAAVLAEMQRMLVACRGPGAREAAMRVIGATGRAADVGTLLDMALETGETVLAPRTEAVLRGAVASLVRREPDALLHLERAWSFRPEALLMPLVEGLGEARDPRALELLDDVLVRHEHLLVAVLAQVRRVGASRSPDVNERLAARLRRYVDPVSPACRPAVFALVTLRDYESVPALIDLLEHDSAGLRADAHFALRELIGHSLRADAALWRAWYDKELAWIDEHAAATLARLGSGADSEVASAISELSRRRLFNDEWAFELMPLLRHPAPSIQRLAAHAIGSLRSPYAVDALVDALGDPSPEVRTAAHGALRATTGRRLPPEQDAWREALPAAQP